ncbi:MAG: hypothetical protein DRH21_08495 [Deltaproteobacteria bacterium]|nr:MAG: hypothetical protein DRH21_08495 [Deltaproteobacteria bacterium]
MIAQQSISKHIVIKLVVLLFVSFTSACNKEQEPLTLDADFMTVADVYQYCQGNCDTIYDWESSDVFVQGYILNFSNDSIRQDYYSNSKFYLQDIRNGMFIEIRINENRDAVFEKIWPADHKNQFFIKGTTEPVIASSDGYCTKGVVVSLIHPDNIKFE